MNKEYLPIPREYEQSSSKFTKLWEEVLERGQKIEFEIVNMLRILESNGYSRTKAIEKIVLDHSHLKGFSRMTIYTRLPNGLKNLYVSPMENLRKSRNVSNDLFEQESQLLEEVNSVVDVLRESIDLTEKINEIERKEQYKREHPYKFMREYIADNGDKIQEYEGQCIYKDRIVSVTTTVNLKTKKIEGIIQKVKPRNRVIDN